MDYEKIDKLIAVHVMGWEIRKVDFTQDGSYFEAFFDEKGNRLGIVGAYEFNPSEYIQDAWIALEKFKEKDFLYTVQNQVGGNYEVSLTDWGGMCSTFRGINESLPLAICKAALKAKGIEI